MASAEQLPSGRWRGVYRDPTGRKLHTTPPHHRYKHDALYAAQEAEVEARRSAPITPSSIAASITWGDWWDRVLADRTFPSATDRILAGYVKVHVRPQWGDVPLNEIGHDAVQDWIDGKVREGYAANTVRQLYKPLRVSIRQAVDRKVLHTSPLERIKLPAVKRKEKQYITTVDVKAFTASMPEEYQDGFNFSSQTGLRPGELAGLHIDQVSDDGYLLVRTVYIQGEDMMRDIPKDDEVRTVPLSPDALAIVRRRITGRENRRGCGVPHYVNERRPEVECTSEIVFRTLRGAVMRPKNQYWHMSKAGVKLGQHQTPYALRRGFATLMARAGVDPFTLMNWMGWSDVNLALEYIQQNPRARAELMSALERSIVKGSLGPVQEAAANVGQHVGHES